MLVGKKETGTQPLAYSKPREKERKAKEQPMKKTV
jgi:hypothetical protein